MQYAFFGSPEFAAIILQCLINAGIPPALVVCNPDRPVGRKKIITPPLTKIVAERYGIHVDQPERLTADVVSRFKVHVPRYDFFIVAAYAQIIPKEILDLPRLGTIGVHPSLLPKYRGATPIQSVLLNCETETGVTLYLMDEMMDHGPAIANFKIQISNDKMYISLMHDLAQIGGRLLIEILPKFVEGKITLMPQEHAQATFTRKFTTEDGFVDLEKDDPIMIDRKVRALNPDPGVYTFIERNGKCTRMKILETKIVDGKLQLLTVQFEGKNPGPYFAFAKSLSA